MPSIFLDEIAQLLPPSHILCDESSLANYGRDHTHDFKPAPAAILFPTTLEQVQAIVRAANQHVVALVPSGGRTGLSGGAVAGQGEVVVSLERMNQILEFDPLERTVTCQAGVITEVVQRFAADQGLYFPVDYASKGSSQIGGNIATNAGGVHVVRYGMIRQWVSALKVVTGRGDVISANRSLTKNATGYDLRHLFIGSEGTLGIVVEATLQLTLPPQSSRVMLLAGECLDHILPVFQRFRDVLTLNAFEFFTHDSITPQLAKGVSAPFANHYAHYLLVDFECTDETAEAHAMQAFQDCLEAAWIHDGVLSQHETQARQFWQLREHISESLAPRKPYKNDISVRLKHIPHFMQALHRVLTEAYPSCEAVFFGHIGDGNLHVNILPPTDWSREQFVAICEQMSHLVFSVVQQFDGSISAEHGVGLLKKPYLHYTRPPEELVYLREIKRAFDSKNIMNPGKIFDY